MNPSLRWWLLAASLLLVNALGWAWTRASVRDAHAADASHLRVLETLPHGDVDLAERLVLRLDRAVGEPGAVLDGAPFELDPPLAGRWEWEAADRLAFVLRTPPPAGRVLRALPAAALEDLLGAPLAPDAEATWTTRSLAFQGARVIERDARRTLLELTFDQPVDPESLGEALRVSEGPRSLGAQVLTEVAVPVHQVQVSGALALAEVRLAAGLLPDGGQRGLAQPVSLELQLPAVSREAQPVLPPQFLSVRAHCLDLVPEATLALRFDRPLDLAQELPQVTLDPPVEGLDVRLGLRELQLVGDLECGRTYRVRVGPGLLGQDGRASTEPITCEVRVPRRGHDLELPRDGVLSTAGHLALTLRAVNVPRVRVRAWRVHEGNLVDEARGESARDTSRLVLDEVRELGGEPDRPETLSLELPELLELPRGVHRVELSDPEDFWVRAACTVRLSDLALTVKDAPGELLVWSLGLADARPREGVVVSAWTRNEQLLVRATTDARGLARLVLPEDLPDGGPFLVTGSLDGDVNLVRPGSRHWVLDGLEASGRPWPEDLDAFLYPDREVVAPGEPVHATVLLRDRHGDVAPDTTLELRLERPDGRLAGRTELTARAALQGFGHGDLSTPREGPTGVWKLELRDAAGRSLASARVLLEDFLPVHLSLEGDLREVETAEQPLAQQARPVEAGASRAATEAVTAEAAAPAPDVPRVRLELRSAHLVGRPAAGLRVDLEGRVIPVSPEIEGCAGFTFARPERPADGGRLAPWSTVLDEQGRLEVDRPLPPELQPGLYSVRLDASVREPGGRAVNRRLETRVDLAGRHLGVREAGGGNPFGVLPVEHRLVDLAGAELDPSAGFVTGEGLAPLRLELHRIEVHWEPHWRDGLARWERVEQRSLVDAVELQRGSGTWQAHVGQAGTHELVALDRATGARSVRRLGIWGEAGAPPEDGPDRVVLRGLDGPLVPGTSARFALTSPFPGTALVTLEADGVRALEVLALGGTDSVVTLPVPHDLVGGATVVASVVRPMDVTAVDWKPHRARGALRVPSTHEDLRLPLALEVPAQALPGAAVEVLARTEPGAAVHLFAVDEGILLAGGDELPDPHAWFTGPRRLAVRTSDVHDELLPDLERPASVRRVGGDRDDELLRPETLEPREEPALVWRTTALADAEGRLAVSAQLPQLQGSLRWIAVAALGRRSGSASSSGIVSSPVALTLSAPRAVAPGDRFELTLQLFETRGRAVQGTLAVHDDARRLRVDLPPAVALEPGQALVLRVPVEVPDPGLASEGGTRLSVRLEGVDEAGEPLQSEASAALVVRAAEGLAEVVEAHVLTAGEGLRLDPLEHLASGRGRLRLRVEATPELLLEPAFDALVEYPHGCAEQTSGKLLALIAHPQGRERFPDWILQGFTRLAGMQTPSGGLTYWPGGESASPWVSCHVALVVEHARARGIATEPLDAGRLADYLERRLLEGDGGVDLQADLVRALAGLGRPMAGWTARLFERRAELDLDARAQLAQACLALERPGEARQVLEEVDPLLLQVTESASERMVFADAALGRWLAVWQVLDPGGPRAQALASALLGRARHGRWGNTLSDALCLAALAGFAEGRPPADWTVTVHGPLTGPLVARADAPLDLRLELAELDGPLRLSSEGDGDVRVLLEALGQARPEDDPAVPEEPGPGDAGALRVQRRYLDAEGRDLDLSAVRAGDLVRVELRLEAPALPAGRSIPNVAVVDLLPGGLAVENPRLATGFAGAGEAPPLPGRARTAAREPAAVPAREGRADRVEFLADRVLLYTTVEREPRLYRYALRAVGPGTYRVPPVVAASMYVPGLLARDGGGELCVSR